MTKKIRERIKRFIKNLLGKKPKQNCKQFIPEITYPDGSWIDVETTADQKRIEDYLENMMVDKKTILHVGTGNSSFAKIFCKNNQVDSITVVDDELLNANLLKLANYNCFKINKYSLDLKKLSKKYDLIVDNNLSSYACCKDHFVDMMNAYFHLLKQNGCIITDQQGMEYHRGFSFPISVEEIKVLFPKTHIKKMDTIVTISIK